MQECKETNKVRWDATEGCSAGPEKTAWVALLETKNKANGLRMSIPSATPSGVGLGKGDALRFPRENTLCSLWVPRAPAKGVFFKDAWRICCRRSRPPSQGPYQELNQKIRREGKGKKGEVRAKNWHPQEDKRAQQSENEQKNQQSPNKRGGAWKSLEDRMPWENGTRPKKLRKQMAGKKPSVSRPCVWKSTMS